ncbi:MAG: hypothetical protein PVH19_01310 [Planctomycetia bacterium]
MSTSNDQHTDHQPTREELRRDRISLAIVFIVFGGLIALMIWLATIAPVSGSALDYYPIYP